MTDQANKKKDDDRLVIPLDPEEAIRALLKVDPEELPTKHDDDRQGDR